MKNELTPGEDRMNAEMLKFGGIAFVDEIFSLISKVLKHERVPEDWNKLSIMSIYKKGLKLICQNYRGKSFLNVLYKIPLKVVAKCLELNVRSNLGEYQAGFKK